MRAAKAVVRYREMLGAVGHNGQGLAMLKSMTGFARCDGALGPVGWHWEIRAVNGRGLDIRLRLPPGCDALEPLAREACKVRLARGNIAMTLTVRREAGATELRLNEAALIQVSAAIARARELVEAGPPSVDGLLTIRGVLEVGDVENEATPERDAAILRDLNEALDLLIEARSTEGARLTDVIGAHLTEIEGLVGEAESAPARAPEAIRDRLRENIGRLLGEFPQLDEQRLHQEAVLLAARADIAEEIDRLKAHLAAARDLLAADAPVGRRLEFLAQEFNRESNTICAKANDPDLSQTGLALKAAVDRLREQVQNIE